eukprot:jgi/Mesvir1/8814/Mv02715-RA.1
MGRHKKKKGSKAPKQNVELPPETQPEEYEREEERREEEGTPLIAAENADNVVLDVQAVEVVEQKPWYTGLVLFLAILTVSSAGPVMKSMSPVSPLHRACWRLQVSSLALAMGFLPQWRSASPELRSSWTRALPLMAISGVSLALHFGAWVWSLDATSLPHSLLLVSASPLILSAAAWIRRDPISQGELLGTGMGTLGGVILAAGAQSDREVTLGGDTAALLAALAFVGYICIGRQLRAWMPLFLYAFAVTLISAITLSLYGLLRGSDLLSLSPHSIFGWASKAWILHTLYLGLGPGLFGHTGFNFLVRYMSPLVVAMAVTTEPLLGSLMGWAAGVSHFPSPWTCVGGSIMILATLVVNASASRREQREVMAAAQGHPAPSQHMSAQQMEDSVSSGRPYAAAAKDRLFPEDHVMDEALIPPVEGPTILEDAASLKMGGGFHISRGVSL